MFLALTCPLGDLQAALLPPCFSLSGWKLRRTERLPSKKEAEILNASLNVAYRFSRPNLALSCTELVPNAFLPKSIRLTAESAKNLNAVSGVACKETGAIFPSLAAPNPAPKQFGMKRMIPDVCADRLDYVALHPRAIARENVCYNDFVRKEDASPCNAR